MVGREGAADGVIGFGGKPAFARGLVQIPGPAVRIPVDVLSDARNESSSLQESFAAYSDCFLAQILQSVACNAVHALVERCCRWLLVAQDRFAMDEMPLTQEFLAETLGVQRTTVTEVMRSLQDQQIVTYHRGRIRILDRRALESIACHCYGAVRDHFERVMPGVYPHYPEGRRKS
jgi:hypothetical protein